jgi:hypothetical protein
MWPLQTAPIFILFSRLPGMAHDWQRGKNIKILGAGSLIFIGAMTLLVLVAMPNL